jgi:TetR/AcrR family fatty acid metabolism transcriptional regulator
MARFSDEQKAMLDEHMQKKICEAATGIIIESGIDNVRMDKVAEAAGVAKGTIYNYFKDKDQLLTIVASTIFDSIFKSITEHISSNSDALCKLQAIAGIMLSSFSRYKKLFMFLHAARFIDVLNNKGPIKKRNELIGIVKNVIETAMNGGQFRVSNSLIAAEIFLGMIMSINISKITTGTERPVQEDLDTVMTIFTKGMQQTVVDNEDTKNEC